MKIANGYFLYHVMEHNLSSLFTDRKCEAWRSSILWEARVQTHVDQLIDCYELCIWGSLKAKAWCNLILMHSLLRIVLCQRVRPGYVHRTASDFHSRQAAALTNTLSAYFCCEDSNINSQNHDYGYQNEHGLVHELVRKFILPQMPKTFHVLM